MLFRSNLSFYIDIGDIFTTFKYTELDYDTDLIFFTDISMKLFIRPLKKQIFQKYLTNSSNKKTHKLSFINITANEHAISIFNRSKTSDDNEWEYYDNNNSMARKPIFKIKDFGSVETIEIEGIEYLNIDFDNFDETSNKLKNIDKYYPYPITDFIKDKHNDKFKIPSKLNPFTIKETKIQIPFTINSYNLYNLCYVKIK